MPLTHHTYSEEDARRELRLKAVFLRNGPYKVTNFQPATGIGKFDLSFDPVANRIEVTVNVAYRFSQDKSKPEQLAWDSSEEEKFRRAAKPLIEGFWSEVYTITCSKPGWHDVFGNVHVKLNEVGLDKAIYIIDVMRLGKPKSSGGINHGSTPYVCGVNNYACDIDTSKSQAALFNYKEGLIRNYLRETAASGTGDYLPFAKGVNELSVETRVTLVKWCGRIRSVLTSELAGVRAFVVGVTGQKDSAFSTGLKAGRANSVADFINGALGRGVDKPFAEVVAESSPLVSAALASLRTRPEPPASTGNPRTGLGGAFIVIGTRGTEERVLPFKYVVMAHEFGHMLGLPDEYMGVHDTYTKSLAALDSIVPKTYQASALAADGDHERLAAMQHGLSAAAEAAGVAVPAHMGTTGSADALGAAMYSAKKEAYWERRDAAKARLGAGTEAYATWRRRNPDPAPPAAMTTISSSIMHSGNEIHPCHYVTIWSALCKATNSFFEPDQWRIVPNASRPSTIRYFKS